MKNTLIFIIYIAIGGVACNEGRKFLLSFPPFDGQFDVGLCQIIINTNNQAQVSITTNDFTDSINVGVGSYIYSLDCSIRAPVGYSNKAVLVESDVDIAVQVYNDRYSWGDVYLARPLAEIRDYLIATPSEVNDAAWIVDFVFTIAAELDGTYVYVVRPVPGGGYELAYTLLLNRFDTYTQNNPAPRIEYTGFLINPNKPVSVLTGTNFYQTSACTHPNVGIVYAPYTLDVDQRFIVPTITKNNPGYTGTFIRIISYAPFNLVELPDQSMSFYLQVGEFYLHYISTWNEITRVYCERNCVVVMYNEIDCEGGEGGFMINVTPLESATEYARFTAIEHQAANILFDNYITIISQTQTVRLDGVVITGWRAIPEWNYFEVSVPIEHGGHVLESGDGGKFVAYVYGHEQGMRYQGYGSAIVA